MIVYSDYYESKLDIENDDLDELYSLYRLASMNIGQSTFISKDYFINNPTMIFDHVCFHAEIIDSNRILEIIKLNTIKDE
jgi:hypothetical protein